MQQVPKLFFMSLLNLACYTNTFEINVIQAHTVEDHTRQKLKDLFVVVFSQAYKHVDIKDINANFDSTPHYLQNLFDTDYKSISNLNFDFIVVQERQEILGYILSCYCPKEKKAYIHHLVVDSNRQSKGMGKNLIKICEGLYKEAHSVALSTRRFNDKAIGFYKHLGFYETNLAPEIAYIIRPNAKNNPQIVNLEKMV